MELTEKIQEIVEQLPKKQQTLILELVQNLAGSDDILSDDDIIALNEADEEYERGECASHEDVWR